ncbi:YchJ family metal-binding protein [Pseudohongiella sp. SYSU M77423]|uniref:YchJ family protein n=1 Tax=Pseudohongiella sp. SYSU M77423 TaxID=3042312 RepID=UPI0024815AAF|nr:YchJ family metal-binding protein [Pseudohongiella sp. SYSU M77423]MDH7944833.1 YchJ family metal-binding protein [Pseudohongiella sp. SYSU M77423]
MTPDIKNIAKNEICPCDSGKRYSICCGSLHAGKEFARTAKQLMRSRYSAFAIGGLGDYLLQTWHPDTRPAVSAEQLGAKDTDWIRLEILDANQSGVTAMVEFKAHWRDETGRVQIHHERSRFLRIKGRWFYLDTAG